MNKFKSFIRQALIGGVLVVLPIVIIATLFQWLFYTLTDFIQPLTNIAITRYQLPELTADLLVIVIILLSCFAIGTLVSTSVGRWLHNRFDGYLTRLAPGYRLVKEIVSQLFDNSKESPFSRGQVVRVKLFGKECPTTVTALVTDQAKDGTVTIFMPTGPNPTSGNIYHLPAELVEYFPDASVEAMMKSVIACGAGSEKLFANKKVPVASITKNSNE